MTVDAAPCNDVYRLGWDARDGEADGTRLRRAALVRALGLVARSPEVVAEAARRLDRFLGGEAAALEANLQEPAVAMVARAGDARRFETFRERYREETDPTFKRRYLLALAAFEDPELAGRARGMALSEEVALQDSAFFVATLLSNRAARDPFWTTMRERWDAVEARVAGAPMLLRRVVEAIGQLPERRHLEEAEALLAAHPVEAAKQAVAQTLERMRQDIELHERIRPAVGTWVASR